MTRIGRWLIPLLALIMLSNVGCITATAVVAGKVVGDAVVDADVKKRGKALRGESLESSDEMFGERHATLFDTSNYDREIVVYPVKGGLGGKSWWIVEAYDGKILELTRKSQSKKSKLAKKVTGKGPDECQEVGKLDPPIHVLQNRDTGARTRVYKGKSSKLSGQAYEVLHFDANDQCVEAITVQVTASTKKDI